MLLPMMLAISVPMKAAPLPRISAVGTSLMADGKPIVLQGVNLGGWFVEEMWMTPWQTDPGPGSPYKKIVDDSSLWHTLSDRLGPRQMNEVRQAWRNNWVTNDDFARIESLGFNHVRIPFRDELLHESGGLAFLDKVIAEAGAHHLYVVLDMHGAPGGQSGDQPSGVVGQNNLWTTEADIAQMQSDWVMLAKRYKHSHTVAMFDIVNEPMGAPNNTVLYNLFGRMINAIRKVNTQTVLLVEDGYKGFNNAPDPWPSGWTNTCFSVHFYNFDAKSSQAHLDAVKGDIARAKPEMEKRNIPMYVGEWNNEPHGGIDVIKPYSQALTNAGFSWAFWTWKVYPREGQLGDWGIVRPSDTNGMRIQLNPFTDSLSSLLKKIKMIKTSDMNVGVPAFATGQPSR